MSAAGSPTVVWTPNVEIVMLLANLTESGPKFQSKAVNAMRRAAWLRFDGDRRSPAVVETGRLIDDGFWLDALAELALAAEPFPKAGFTYPLAHETLLKAGTDRDDGYTRLERYLEYAAAFTLDAEVLEFLKLQGNAYRAAVEELEDALGQLSPKARAALILHRRDGFSLEEIATRLAVSRPMAKKYLAKALLHCRQRMEHKD